MTTPAAAGRGGGQDGPGLFDAATLHEGEAAARGVLADEAIHARPVSASATRAVRGTGDLRAWQRAALGKYLETGPRDFLAVATPGAGKTTFGLRLAAELLAGRTVDQLIVVAPTEHLKHQWAAAAARAGIALDSHFTNAQGTTSSDYRGIVVTYAQVAAHPFKHRVICDRRRTLVILDEIHHAGDAKSWGEAIEEAYQEATRRLSLTGTPFRSDDNRIPFVEYEPDAEGRLRSRADHAYGYSEALADGVVRPVVFLAYSGEARWKDSAGEEYAARLGEPLDAASTSRAWRTALDPGGDWMPAVLSAAHTRLHTLREGGMHDAGGLVIATDRERARAYADLLTRLTGERPVVVLSDEPGSSSLIEEFAGSTREWMVAVRMVSEGVDVPRLAVGVYATSASTPLYFAQAIGRFVRSRRPGETASVFLPSVPVLLELAAQMEAQREHVLGVPHRPQEGWDDELIAEANRTKDEPGAEEKSYTSLGADAELDHLIYDGSTYGTATLAGSAEEQEYLGLPGLLDAEQMRHLLSRRQEEQLARPGPEKRPADAGEVASVEERLADAAVLPGLRRELNALVSIESRREGRPHGAIHTELRQACGGPPVPMATATQLRARIAHLRRF